MSISPSHKKCSIFWTFPTLVLYSLSIWHIYVSYKSRTLGKGYGIICWEQLGKLLKSWEHIGNIIRNMLRTIRNKRNILGKLRWTICISCLPQKEKEKAKTSTLSTNTNLPNWLPRIYIPKGSWAPLFATTNTPSLIVSIHSFKNLNKIYEQLTRSHCIKNWNHKTKGREPNPNNQGTCWMRLSNLGSW